MAFAVLLATALLSTQSWAQDAVSSYKVGERVEYREGYPPREVWFEGTIVKLYPDNRGVLVHWDPRPDYAAYNHDGKSNYEQAYDFDRVRHIKTRPADKPVAENGGPIKIVPQQPVAGDGKGVMTHEEILGYMRAHGYANGQPKRDVQVCIDLVEQIKARGVTSPLEVYKDDLEPYYKNDCGGFVADDVVRATTFNIGTPTTNNWLFDTWIMYVIGGTVDTAPGDGYIHRKNESMAKMGFLTINSNGTYIWKIYPTDPPAKFLKGTWRNATKVEMKVQGGAGIVLHQGEAGADWIVFKYMDASNKAERVEVENMDGWGGNRRIGWR